MSSSVFFKFKSSKEPQRITFDGTGISVFELKREIISASGLGDGTDFDLSIYNDDTNEAYDDDTVIIPRSTSVVARRFPASKPGHGRAARYVSGKMPVNAKNTHRVESMVHSQSQSKSGLSNGMAADTGKAQTEEEKIAAMFKAGGDQWEQTQQAMANVKPVHRGGYKKQVNVPDHDPPPGYICYRCHQKGHWIQACPTNDDPNFENRPRIKRTTGIPRSFLKTVEKPAALSNDGLTDDTKQPSGIMVNAEGEYVIAEPDKASWEQYQAKAAKATAAQQEAQVSGSKELQDRGLECPIDKRLFVEPMKTPCCGTTYCNDCIENALVNSDLMCPNCGKDGVLIDNLTADEEVAKKIVEYEKEKAEERKAREASKSPEAAPADITSSLTADKGERSKAKSPSPAVGTPRNGNTPSTAPAQLAKGDDDSAPAITGKKRPAEEELKNDHIPSAPAAMRRQQEEQKRQQAAIQAAMDPTQQFINQMNALGSMPMANGGGSGGGGGGGGDGMMNGMNNMMGGMQGMAPMNGMGGINGMNGMNNMMGMGMNPSMNNMMGMNGMNNMNGMAMGMPGMPGMNNMNGMNPMMMNGMPRPNNAQWNQPQNNMYAANQPFPNRPHSAGPGWQQQQQHAPHQQSQQQQQQQQMLMMQQQQQQAGQGGGGAGGGGGVFPNQQRTFFSEPFPNEEDNAYFRKPVNPHRHQNRQRRGVRPSDYTEL